MPVMPRYGFSSSKLRAARRAKGLTSKQAAELCGVLEQLWLTWENGRIPTQRSLQRISQALTVAPADLISTRRERWTLLTLRMAACMSRLDAARAAGLSTEMLQKLETGTDLLTDEAAQRLAETYGATLEEVRTCHENAFV